MKYVIIIPPNDNRTAGFYGFWTKFGVVECRKTTEKISVLIRVGILTS
jgi:hypothetical protein